MLIVANKFHEAWFELLLDLAELGEEVAPRKMDIQEILGVTIKVQNGLQNILVHPMRSLNYKFMVAEWLWIISGSDTLETIAQYNSELRKFSDDGKTLYGAYGPRLAIQLEWLKLKLDDKHTRQAVVTIWRPNEKASNDIPCTISLQFIARAKLNLIVNMRSSDIWLGLPYDFFVFSQILNALAWYMDMEVGFVQFNLGSSHLYRSNLEQAKRVIDLPYSGDTVVSPRITSEPPEVLWGVLKNPKEAAFTAKLLTDFSPQPWYDYMQILTKPKENALDWLKNLAG